jgi:predicted house-cleaning noncanonical NTP pyrophosphatase (MazG superfamily)
LKSYNKAIRDKIPEIIQKDGKSCDFKKLSDDEFLVQLEKKLYEEIEEYTQSKSIEELADLLEIIERIAELKGTTVSKLFEIKNQKIEKRGKFEKNLFLISTD